MPAWDEAQDCYETATVVHCAGRRDMDDPMTSIRATFFSGLELGLERGALAAAARPSVTARVSAGFASEFRPRTQWVRAEARVSCDPSPLIRHPPPCGPRVVQGPEAHDIEPGPGT